MPQGDAAAHGSSRKGGHRERRYRSKQVVGIDLQLHRSVIGRIDDHGNELGWVRIDNDPRALRAECRKAGRGAAVVIEATYGWYWAVDALLAAGFDVHLAHALRMKALRKHKRVKTDPRDAYELEPAAARLAAGGLHGPTGPAGAAGQAQDPAPGDRPGRRHRDRADGRAGVAWQLRQRLASQRRLLLVLADEIASTEVELHRRLRHHPGYRSLLTVKGVGPVLAAVFVREIGDIGRFPTAAALCCWVGLTPRHYESDKTVHRGHISKEGDTLVRWAAVEAIQR